MIDGVVTIVTSEYVNSTINQTEDVVSALTEVLEIVVVSTGEQGAAGRKGDDGRSAYEVWLSLGNVGTEADYINSLVGATGKSAYQEWLDLGNVGTESDFIESLSINMIGGLPIQVATPSADDVLLCTGNAWVNSPQNTLTDGGNF